MTKYAEIPESETVPVVQSLLVLLADSIWAETEDERAQPDADLAFNAGPSPEAHPGLPDHIRIREPGSTPTPVPQHGYPSVRQLITAMPIEQQTYAPDALRIAESLRWIAYTPDPHRAPSRDPRGAATQFYADDQRVLLTRDGLRAVAEVRSEIPIAEILASIVELRGHLEMMLRDGWQPTSVKAEELGRRLQWPILKVRRAISLLLAEWHPQALDPFSGLGTYVPLGEWVLDSQVSADPTTLEWEFMDETVEPPPFQPLVPEWLTKPPYWGHRSWDDLKAWIVEEITAGRQSSTQTNFAKLLCEKLGGKPDDDLDSYQSKVKEIKVALLKRNWVWHRLEAPRPMTDEEQKEHRRKTSQRKPRRRKTSKREAPQRKTSKREAPQVATGGRRQ